MTQLLKILSASLVLAVSTGATAVKVELSQENIDMLCADAAFSETHVKICGTSENQGDASNFDDSNAFTKSSNNRKKSNVSKEESSFDGNDRVSEDGDFAKSPLKAKSSAKSHKNKRKSPDFSNTDDSSDAYAPDRSGKKKSYSSSSSDDFDLN